MHLAVTVILSLGAALFLWHVTIPNAYYVDFSKAYFVAGKFILTNPAELYKGIQPEFVNIPIVAYLFSPLPLVGLERAVHLMVLASIIPVMVSCWWIIRSQKLEGHTRLLVIFLFAVNGPLFYSIRLGNLTHFVLLLITIVMVLGDRKRFLAGTLAAICAIIKLPLMLFGLYFIARRRWASAFGFWLTIFAIFSLSILVAGFDLHLKWYEEVIQRNSGQVMGAYNNQSVNGFLAHLIPGNNLYSWVEYSTGMRFKAAQLLITGLIAGSAAWILWRSGPPSTTAGARLEYAIVLCVCILISPISWIHYYSLLIVPLAFCFSRRNPVLHALPGTKEAWENRVLILATTLITLPVVHTMPDSVVPNILFVEALFRRVLVSHYFYGGIILLGFFLYLRMKVSGFMQRDQINVSAKVSANIR